MADGVLPEGGRVQARPAVSVVICAYTERRWEDLVAGLAALRPQLRDGDEALVVIDYNDALLERARLAHPWARVMPNAGRKGLSGARNTGIAAAAAPIVAFLDDDAEPQPGWLAELVAPLSDGTTLGTGGVAIPRFPGERPDFLPRELDWVVGCSYAGQPTRPEPVRNVMGCSMAFRKDVFDAVGGFTEGVGRIDTVPLGGEETELCIRVGQRFGPRRIMWVPASVVRHRVDPDRVRWGYLAQRGWAEGTSKATIATMVGASDTTSTERGYLLHTIPAGLAREAKRGLRGDVGGVRGILGILLTVASVVFGYGRGRAGQLVSRRGPR